jgi:hypothetical protein
LLTFDERTRFESDYYGGIYVFGEGGPGGEYWAWYSGAELAGRTLEILGGEVYICMIINGIRTDWGFRAEIRAVQ